MKKKIKMLLVILSLLCLYSCKSSEEKTKEREEKMLDDYVEMLENEFNLTLDKWEYYVKEEHIVGGNLIKNPESYVLYKYDVPKYKSEFFYDRGLIHVESPPTKFVFRDGSMLIPFLKYEDIEKVPFFNKTGKSNLLFEIIDKYGLRPYLWSQLIYDKSKGNDFEKIESILKKHGIKYDKEHNMGSFGKWACGIIQKEWNGEIFTKSLTRHNTTLTVIDEECGDEVTEGKFERMKIYGKKFEEYFSRPRKFEEIDWYEFMKYNDIHPIIVIYVTDYPEEKVKKIVKEIRPYYNHEDFTILFSYYIDNGKGYTNKYLW